MLQALKTFAADKSCTVEGFCTNLPQADADRGNLQTIVGIVVSILAVIAVLIIVIAALNIITANGDAAKVAKSRGAIIYALIGLVVAVSATVIVNIIVENL